MELTSLKNIGKEMQRKLNIIDIKDAETLTQLGSKEVFFRLKMRFPEVCLVHLYVIQGAVDGTNYNELSKNVKKELKKFNDSL